MNTPNPQPPVSICVLTYSDFPELAMQSIGSIIRHCDRSLYRLIVGANAVGDDTLCYVEQLHAEGAIDELILSPINLYKCPMMRRMFERVGTEFVWWFDDDSYVVSDLALSQRIDAARRSPAEIAMWGQEFKVDDTITFCAGDPVEFVRAASWYRGLTPPSRKPGGKGELDFDGTGRGNGFWSFIRGGEWFVRTSALRELNWPDRRINIFGDDVFLGEAVRQQGWKLCNTGSPGVAISQAKRRWSPHLSEATANQ